ncbi:MAG: bifunctional UDP-sugar hydrolase/5'-nucleotidase [Planctomycetota bacterium]|jgi:2',3'-cyclic-nucleotide 2'-phosphodiesterase (5'-nucleotidase family)|nr:bifunctional UDP-sugar hydrolase/5'-nucleotidase [Planctomycetota bacterium]
MLLARRTLLTRLGPLAVLLAVVSGFIRPDAASAERFHVILLHTNDVHGQAQPRPATWIDRENPPPVGGLPRLAAYVNKARTEAKGSGSGFLLVDGGDWFQGTPEGNLGQGKPFVSALMELGYDGLAVGNHELDHGLKVIGSMIAECKVPALAANVLTKEGGEHVDWCEPYRIVTLGDLRVGIVGLLTPSTPSITHEDASSLFFEDPAVSLKRVQTELADRVDWVLPITHLGVTADRRLAKAVPELEVIVGGHSHTYLKDGVRQGETLIVQSGSKASAIGRIDLWFDPKDWTLVEVKNRMVDLVDDPARTDRNESVEARCEEMIAESEKVMNQVVGDLADPFERRFHRVHSCAGGNFLTDRMRAAAGADVAFQNRGGIRCDLPAGPITRRNLFELLPFGNRLVLMELSGSDLYECIRMSVEGTAHTGLEVSGVTVLWTEAGDGYKLTGVEVGGTPIDLDAKYKVATNNFLVGGGDGYDVLKGKTVLRDDPTILRDILGAHFLATKSVQLPDEDRYRRSK